MKPLSTRTAGFTDSVIRRMTRISNKYGAINLSQGFPDFDPPKEITNRLAEIANVGPHQYAITWGAQNFIVIKYDGYVITDEVYEHIVYAPHQHVYISTLPGMWERTISCSSLSKTYSITGWRLGYVIAPERIIERVKKVHDFLTVGAAAPLMEAATVGLCFPDSYYEELQAHYTHMKQLFCDGLQQFGLTFTDPQGAYYVLLDVSKYGVKDDLHFCEWLAEHVGVGAVPGSCFFRERLRVGEQSSGMDVHHLIRFHFAKRDETLNAALDRLSELDSKAKHYHP